MQSVGSQADGYVARLYAAPVNDAGTLDHADGEAGQVEVITLIEVWYLGCLAT